MPLVMITPKQKNKTHKSLDGCKSEVSYKKYVHLVTSVFQWLPSITVLLEELMLINNNTNHIYRTLEV